MSLLKIMILAPKMYLLSGVTLVEISIYVIVIKVNSRARPHNYSCTCTIIIQTP